MERKRFSGVMLLFIVLAVVLITQVVGNLCLLYTSPSPRDA